ncbi:MAG: hypothetical protein NTU44_10945, partial [Bacteroidetes bacterium]|nr:hypothetical protein [Bacteroidota bacterium]
SDGIDSDTAHIQTVVYTQQQAEVSLSFSSLNLYENDNKFVKIWNYRSVASGIWATVTNINTGDSVDVSCRKVDEFEYIGKFDLSFAKNTALPVSNGDSLKLTYTYNGQTYITMARYDSLPQPSDIISPGTITDLRVEYTGDNQLKLKWTATGNDDTTGKAYKYDIRYAFSTINNDTNYLTSNRILQYPYPALPGETDSLVLAFDTLSGIQAHDTLWFAVKAEDENQNRSALGNSPSLSYCLAPRALKASLDQSFKVNLSWQGQNSAGFQHFNLYRKADDQNFILVTDTIVSSFYTDNLFSEPDESCQYAIQAVYFNGNSDSVYSNIIDIERFVDVLLLCQLEDTDAYDSVTFTMHGLDTLYSQSFNRITNISGLVLMADVFFGNYSVSISKPGYQTIEETIFADNDYFSFIFTLNRIILPQVLSGKVLYDNIASSPLGNIKVYLKTVNNSLLDSTLTNVNGEFSFTTMPGEYHIGIKCSKPIGGLNSLDALIICKHFVGMDTLTGIRLIAADVDGSGKANA